MDTRVEIVEGDITTFEVDAVVNAANSSLLGGGGVDGAIHRAAGPGLLEECRALGGCPVGEARVTGAHDLPATWVVHTVGPVWRGGTSGESEQLAAAYGSSLTLAERAGARSVALPLISAGAYGFPTAEACRIALMEIERFLSSGSVIEHVFLVCFGRRTLDVCREVAAAL